MRPSNNLLSAYLFFSVCCTMAYIIMFYVQFILASYYGGTIIVTNAYGEMWFELALLAFTAPGVILGMKHLISHWFI